MAVEVVPIPLPPSVDKARFSPEFGREVKGVKAGELTEDQFKEVSDLLYRVSSHTTVLTLTATVCTDTFEARCTAFSGHGTDSRAAVCSHEGMSLVQFQTLKLE